MDPSDYLTFAFAYGWIAATYAAIAIRHLF